MSIKKGDIICIVGKTATGKDTVVREILKRKSFNGIKLNKTTSYTTRPRRQTESDEYYFVDKTTFDNLSFIEHTSYNVGDAIYEYGMTKDEFKDDKINVVIVNPRGLKTLLSVDDFNGRLIVATLNASLSTRITRYRGRETSSNVDSKLVDRLIQDENDFKDLDDLLLRNYCECKVKYFKNFTNEDISIKDLVDCMEFEIAGCSF